MNKKIITASDAIDIIKDNSVIASSGFRWSGSPELILSELGKKYRQNKKPSDLTLIFASAQGDSLNNGLENLAQKGLFKRVIGGFWGISPKLFDLANNNDFEAYNLPQGIITRLYSAITSNAPGVITKTGLGTFIDPRMEGGKLNNRTNDNLIEVVRIRNEDYLLYHSIQLDIGFIRGTYADESGNLSLDKEAVSLELLPLAMAVHNCGGKIIAQVEKIVDKGFINPKNVAVPGYLVDYIVVAENIDKEHRQCCAYTYEPSLAGNKIKDKIPLDITQSLKRKVIAQRAIKELRSGNIVNLGQGIPTDIIPLLKNYPGIRDIHFTLESGISGGVPHAVPDFGISYNPESMIRPDDMFYFFNGGGLDVCFLGFAEVDKVGNINVSKFGNKFVGCGGFIDIAQNTKNVVFCGTFTAKGLKVLKENGYLVIKSEGELPKFVNRVQQITFNPSVTHIKDQDITIITERCVFKVKKEGLELIEIAPGIDLNNNILSIIDFEIKISPNLKPMLIE